MPRAVVAASGVPSADRSADSIAAAVIVAGVDIVAVITTEPVDAAGAMRGELSCGGGDRGGRGGGGGGGGSCDVAPTSCVAKLIIDWTTGLAATVIPTSDASTPAMVAILDAIAIESRP